MYALKLDELKNLKKIVANFSSTKVRWIEEKKVKRYLEKDRKKMSWKMNKNTTYQPVIKEWEESKMMLIQTHQGFYSLLIIHTMLFKGLNFFRSEIHFMPVSKIWQCVFFLQT